MFLVTGQEEREKGCCRGVGSQCSGPEGSFCHLVVQLVSEGCPLTALAMNIGASWQSPAAGDCPGSCILTPRNGLSWAIVSKAMALPVSKAIFHQIFAHPSRSFGNKGSISVFITSTYTSTSTLPVHAFRNLNCILCVILKIKIDLG